MAARSLRCGQCGTLLTSVKEAQNHNEATGHVQFEEAEEEVRVFACTHPGCGKKARTDAEKGLHQRFTGHSTWEETVCEHQRPFLINFLLDIMTALCACSVLQCQSVDAVIDTEQQMQHARKEMEANEQDDLALLRKSKKGKETASSSSAKPAEQGEAPSTSARAQNMVCFAGFVHPSVMLMPASLAWAS